MKSGIIKLTKSIRDDFYKKQIISMLPVLTMAWSYSLSVNAANSVICQLFVRFVRKMPDTKNAKYTICKGESLDKSGIDLKLTKEEFL
ncbi:MAG: hypothetical protein LUH57_05105 [Ruminococcus sp.]|nr:hypothetical protein [Ruminococcus sp.]